jgi:5-methylcytosine-specific restriction endonuclease McrA
MSKELDNNEITMLDFLPPSMKARARWAREQLILHPEKAEIDEDEVLAWIYDPEDKCWYSIAGNYSFTSPADKMRKRREVIQKNRDYELKIDTQNIERSKQIEFESGIREKVLRRDNYTCQNCNTTIGKFHVHHILKRVLEGTWHYDNLITVCARCHKKVEQKE